MLTNEQLQGTGWPDRIRPHSETQLKLLHRRGRVSENIEETEPSCPIPYPIPFRISVVYITTDATPSTTRARHSRTGLRYGRNLTDGEWHLLSQDRDGAGPLRAPRVLTGRSSNSAMLGIVERFFAWINQNRRLAKDFKASIGSAEAFLYAAPIMVLIKRHGRA